MGGTESAFGICSFWNVEARALQGDVADATDEFEHLLSLCNDVGLFAEEIHVRSGAAVGNFPQAFTHVGLIDAAVTLTRLCDESPASPAASGPVRSHV